MQDKKTAITAELLVAAKNHVLAGRLADAVTVISTLETKQWGGIKTLRMRAAVQKKLVQTVDYGETLRLIAEHGNSAPSDLFRLAAYLVSAGRLDEARTVMVPLKDREDSGQLLLNFAYLEGMQLADARLIGAALRGLLELDVPLPYLPELRLTLRELTPEDRSAIAEAIKTKWPEKAVEINVDPCSDVAHSTIAQRAAKLATEGALAAGQDLLATGREADEELRYALTLIPPPEARRRALIVDNGQNVIVSPRGSSGKTLVVFTGLADQAMVPIECIDAFCSAAGHSAIYLRDSSRSLFIGGVPHLTPDYTSSLARLKAMIMNLETRELLCFGSSAGGFAAVRYGLAMSASRVLCASGATCSREDFLEKHGDQRGRLVVRRLQRTFTEREMDLHWQVTENLGRTRIELCYGEGSRTDVAHAKYLEGLSGVSLHPLVGLNRHGSLPRMMIDGIFQEFIADVD